MAMITELKLTNWPNPEMFFVRKIINDKVVLNNDALKYEAEGLARKLVEPIINAIINRIVDDVSKEVERMCKRGVVYPVDVHVGIPEELGKMLSNGYVVTNVRSEYYGND
jgi:hypothetical protein